MRRQHARELLPLCACFAHARARRLERRRVRPGAVGLGFRGQRAEQRRLDLGHWRCSRRGLERTIVEVSERLGGCREVNDK